MKKVIRHFLIILLFFCQILSAQTYRQQYQYNTTGGRTQRVRQTVSDDGKLVMAMVPDTATALVTGDRAEQFVNPLGLMGETDKTPDNPGSLILTKEEKKAWQERMMARVRQQKPFPVLETEQGLRDAYDVGAIKLDYGISQTGARTYSVPILTAPDIKYAPSLVLAYHSQGGYGYAGYGWTLSGFSEIRLVAKTPYYDGKSIAPSSEVTDAVFALDGVRLVANDDSVTSSSYPLVTAQGHILVKANTTNSGFIKSFTVRTPDGNTATFGLGMNSPVCNYPAYPILSSTNLDGDRIEYEYSVDNEGNYSPLRVKYGFNAQGAAEGVIQFTFFTQTAYGYFAGKKVVRSPRVTRIVSSSGDVNLYTYNLSYSNSATLLSSVSLTNAAGKQLTPLRFTYGADANPHSTQDSLQVIKTVNLPILMDPGPMKMSYRRGKFVKGTYNDGLLGVLDAPIYSRTGEYTFACNYPSDYPIVFTPSICDSDTSSYILSEAGFQALEAVDVNGDGLDEVVKVNCGNTSVNGSVFTIKVYECNSDGTLSLSNTYNVTLAGSISNGSGAYSPCLRTYRWGDYCGNGKAQLLVVCYSDNGFGFGQASYHALVDLSNGDIVCENVLEGTHAYVESNQDGRLICVDIDSDTQTELCLATESGLRVYKHTEDDGFHFSKLFSSVPMAALTDKRVYFTDINADGYIDILNQPSGNTDNNWPCRLNTGLDFVYQDIAICPRDTTALTMFIDVNRDGYPDLVKLKYNYFKYSLNNNGVAFGSLSDAHETIGLGLQAILPANVMEYTAMSSFVTIEKRSPASNVAVKAYGFTSYEPERRQLVQSRDSYGKLVRNTYEYLPHSSRAWTESPSGIDASLGYQLRVLPLYVLSGTKGFMSEDTGAQVFLQETYAWYDGVVNTRGLGFCGFSKNRVATSLESVYRVQANRYNPQKRGIPVSSTLYPLSEGHPPISQTTFTFDNHSTTYGKLSPRLIQSVTNDNVTGIISTTSYNYDAFDYPTLVTTSKRIGTSAMPKLIKQTTTYNHSNNPTTYVLGAVASSETLTERDGNMNTMMGDRSVYTYDTKFHPLSRKDYFVVNTTASLLKSLRWTYDTHGNVLTEESAPYSATEYVGTSYTYDSEGRHMLTSTNELGQTTTYSNFNTYGNPCLVKDFRNRSKAISYDSWGKPTRTAYADGTVDSTATAWSGTAVYMVTHRVTGRPTTITHYDAMAQEVVNGTQRYNGQWQYTKKYYDGKGRLSRVSLPYRGASPTYYTRYQYDGYDRLIRITEASGRITTRSYSGTSVTETKDGISITRTANALGNIISVTDASGTVTYALRDDGQPSSITAPGNVTTTFAYDVFGRRTNLMDPSAGSRNSAYTWNSDGSSVTTETNDIGSVATHVDKYGRITDVIRTGAGAFDTAYNYNSYGLLTSIVSTNGTREDYNYDGYDRVVTFKDSAPDGKFLLKTYSYGSGSIVSGIQYISQSGVITTENYSYTNGHNTSITLTDGTTVFSLIGENDFGQPTSATSGDVSRSYTYTAYGYPTERKLSAGNVTLQKLWTTFNASTGNLTRRVNAAYTPYEEEEFLYDNLGRLTKEYNRVVAYDSKGNITSKGGTGTMDYANTSAPYQTTTLNAASASVTRPNTQTISYTSYDRPMALSEGGAVASFTYDSHYARKRMQVMYGTTVLQKKYYLGDCYEREETSSSTTERLFLGGDAYSAPMVLQRTGTGTWTAYVIGRDYMGSITHIATKTGTLVAEYSYDAWGRMRDPSSLTNYAATSEPTLLLGRGYCGHEHLPAFGLINMNARLFDPVLGRFISPDPYIQAPDFSQNFNRYAYALNNPLKYGDPSGEFVITTAIIIGAAIGFTAGAISGYMIGRKRGAQGMDMLGYILGGGFIGGVAGFAGGAVASLAAPLVTAAGYGGFAAGAITGGLSGAAAGAINGFGFSLLGGSSLTDAFQAAGIGLLTGAAIGAVVGGTVEGIRAAKNENDFWTGKNPKELELDKAIRKIIRQQSPSIKTDLPQSPDVYDLNRDINGPNVTLYRGLSGSENCDGFLFMTDNLEYAQTYGNGGVVKVVLSKFTLEQMYENGDLLLKKGIHMIGNDLSTCTSHFTEVGFSSSVKPYIVNLFTPL